MALGVSHSGGVAVEDLQLAANRSYCSPNMRNPPSGRIRKTPIVSRELQFGLTASVPNCY